MTVPDASEHGRTPAEKEPLSLDERKFRLEQKRFELERLKSRGFLGFFNSNLGIVITAIIGAGTVTVSYLQLRISNQSASAQLELQRQISDSQIRLETEKAQIEQRKNDRGLQAELARLLLDKANEFNTDDEKRVPYLREVLITLPTDVGIRIMGRMANAASRPSLRSQWNDSVVNLQLSEAVPSATPSEFSITLDYLVAKFPQLADKRDRLTDLLDVSQELKLGDAQTTAIMLAYIFYKTFYLSILVENLNYSAQRLQEIFPRVFPVPSDAESVAHDPRALANKIYAHRFGNVEPDDGWRFRGRGYLMTTGRAEYQRASAFVGIDLIADPDALVTSKVAAREAIARVIQLPLDRRSIKDVMLAFQGGFVGLAEVQKNLEKLVPESPKLTEGLTIIPSATNDSSRN
jgi:predicted chitinase